jgi:hypothetical protein
MEHRVAEEKNAVERYLLDEFTPEERAEFEAHLFDCEICGGQVRQNAIALANVREVWEEERRLSEASRQRSRNHGWAAWFRVPALAPSVAALALAAMVGYQKWVYIPMLERPQVFSMSTITPQARDADSKPITTDESRPTFVLTFDVDGPQRSAYTCEFRGANGAAILKLGCGSWETASFTLGVVLPTKKFPAGRYEMILHPAAEPETEIQRFSFAIERRGHT